MHTLAPPQRHPAPRSHSNNRVPKRDGVIVAIRRTAASGRPAGWRLLHGPNGQHPSRRSSADLAVREHALAAMCPNRAIAAALLDETVRVQAAGSANGPIVEAPAPSVVLHHNQDPRLGRTEPCRAASRRPTAARSCRQPWSSRARSVAGGGVGNPATAAASSLAMAARSARARRVFPCISNCMIRPSIPAIITRLACA